jgi:hypothetical protein
MNIPAESVAIVERIAAFSVAVVDTSMTRLDDKSQAEEGVGSATAIRGEERLFLLTAKHNVENASVSDLAFMPKPMSASIFGSSQGPIDRFNIVSRLHLPVAEIICCPWEDLAVLPLETSFEEGQEPARHMEFFKWRDGISSPAVGSTIAALGYPVSRNYVVADRRAGNSVEREMAVTKHIMSCEVVPNERGRYVINFDPDRHFLVDFSHLLDSYEPHGFSGCGWWKKGDDQPAVWTANPIFAGVEIRFARDSRLLLSIRPEIVDKWLKELSF